VAKQHVMCYQQITMFTSFEESIRYSKFCIEALRYNKTSSDWRLDHYFKFFLLSL